MVKIEVNEEEKTILYPAGEIPLQRFNIVVDDGRREEDGSWTVTRTAKQVVTFDDKTWFVREYSVKSMDKSFKKADITTHRAISAVLDDYEGDFFSKEDWDGEQFSIKEGDSEEALSEGYHGIPKDVENS
jgi:hypothetical protein